MKRFVSFLLLFSAIISYAYTNSIINDINNFSKLFPRSEGSENEKESIRQIKIRLDELGIENREYSFQETKGYHSFSSYLEADIKGRKEETLITIIPVGNNFDIAAGLLLAEYFISSQPELSMKFLFLGAENDGNNALGSKNFLEHYYPEQASVFIYLNFKTAPSSVRIISGADGYTSPFMLYHATVTSLKDAAIPVFHSTTESLLFRLSAAGTTSMLKPYLAESYPAIELTDYSTAFNDNEIISEEAVIGFYNGLLNHFSAGIPAEWDSHYLFGISEQIYLFVYIILAAMLMVFPIFRRRHFGWYMKTLLRNLWFIPVLFGSVFLVLFLGTVLTTFILSRLEFTELWKYNPVAVFMFKISTAMFIYTLAFKLISRLPYSKRGSFYSITAIFFLVIVLFFLTWVNLSLSFFALWPLFFIFLFTVFKKSGVKLVMLILSSVLISFSVYEIFALPSFSVIRMITISPVKGNLLSALILLPFILAAIRLEMLSPPSKKFTRLLPLLSALCSVGLFIFIISYSPFSTDNPQPVQIYKTVDENTDIKNVTVNSPWKLDDNITESLLSEKIEAAGDDNDITIGVETRAFLNRKIVKTTIDTVSPPERIRISLLSDTPITIYESNFPVEWLPSQGRLEIFIGKNPPVPLFLSLTLNRNAPLNFSITADYPVETEFSTINDKYYSISRYLTAKKNYIYE